MARNGATLDPLDEYRFEAGGWLVLPGVLSLEDLGRLDFFDESMTEEGSSSAAEHLSLTGVNAAVGVRAVVDALMWPGAAAAGSSLRHELLQLPSPLDNGGSDGYLVQWADGRVRDYAKHYQTHHGHRVCMGVRAVWCMSGSSDFVLVPGSHTASVPTPACVLGRGSPLLSGPVGDAGGVCLPPLKAGDVLLHAANMVWGRRGGAGSGSRLLGAEFTAINDAQNLLSYGHEPRPPSWLQDLSSTQLAAIGWHPSGGNGGECQFLPSHGHGVCATLAAI
jgi:hypothetical protein